MNQTGKYTVHEVVERTAVAAGTLRQWERRYGVPHPDRSDSGYRLYSEDDLRVIEAMKRYIADGVPASRAAELVARVGRERRAPAPALALRRRLVDAFLALDEEAAERVLGEAHALHPVEIVVPEVIGGAMVVIGDLWHEGRIETTTEHFASSFVHGWLRHLMSMTSRRGAGSPVLVACAPTDRHQIGPMMLALLLRRAGHSVVFLGADTPLEDLHAMARSVGAWAVMIGASNEIALDALRERRALLSNIAPVVVYGGAAFDRDPSQAELLGGLYLADDIRQVVERFDELSGRTRWSRA